MASTSSTRSDRAVALRDGIGYCLQRANVRRTLRIAAVVGVVLTLINLGSVIADGHATTATWVRCALNFVVSFLVSNAGLLSGRDRATTLVRSDSAAHEPGARGERERAAR